METQTEEYKIIGGCSAHGRTSFGIRISAFHSEFDVSGKHELIRDAVYKAQRILEDAIERQGVELSPGAKEYAKKEKEEILSLFAAPIFVEEIPNGYSSAAYCSLRPWFIVTTSVGRIKIGWRKRVLNIDWSDTVGTYLAEELFAAEQTTKGEKSIHAWSLEKAKKYIDIITGPELRTPAQWQKVTGAVIMDPDGWRGTMFKDFEEPVTLKEFNERLMHCTVSLKFAK